MKRSAAQPMPGQSNWSTPFPGRVWRRLAAITLVLGLVACDREQARSEQLYVFGTVVEVTTWNVPAGEADAAFAQLQQMFDRMHRDWHAWEPGMLTRLNRAFANGTAEEVSEDIVYLVRRSQALEQASGGRFNPAIGGLIGLWGFHTSDYPIMGPPPAREDIERWIAQSPSSLDITIDGQLLSSENPAVQLDFGGVAKCYAVDLAIARLRNLGIENAIVNTGGDLRAMGRRGDRPWRIAVRRPGGGVIGAVEVLEDESLFTSGNYERFRQDQELRYPHILDPRTGWPVRDIASATVIADEGLAADAAATALVVGGLSEWVGLARDMGLRQVMIVDGEGHVFMTPEMAVRVRLVDDLETTTIDPFL